MVTFKKIVVALCIVVGAAFASFGEAQWTASTWVCTNTVSSAGNILRGKSATITRGSVTRPEKFTDGVPVITSGIPYDNQTAKDERRNSTAYVEDNVIAAFDFDLPSTLNEIKVYTLWQDEGRTQISVRAIDAVLSSGDVVCVYTNETGSYTQQNQNYTKNIFPLAILKDSEGEPLAKEAVSIIFNFGAQQNHAVGYAEIEVVGSADYSATLMIEADGEAFGKPVPDYGVYADRAIGTNYKYVAPEGYFYNESENVRSYASGWRMDFLDSFSKEVTNSVSGTFADGQNSFECVHKGYARLTWLFTTEYKVEFSGTSISFGDAVSPLWVKAGETCTISAVVGDGATFSHWETNIEGMETFSETAVSFAVNAPASLVAYSCATLYVDGGEVGSDETGDGSAAKPYKTIEKAIAVSGDYDEIIVRPCEGGYQLTTEQSLFGARKLRGSTGDFNDVVIYAAKECRAFKVNGEVALIEGVTIDGLHGQTANNGGCIYIDGAGTIKNCRITRGKIANTKFGGGIYNKGGKIIDCIVDNCVGGGNNYRGLAIYQEGDGALIDRCIVTNNTHSVINVRYGYNTAGIRIVGGLLRQSLIAFNSGGRINEGGSDGLCGFAVSLSGNAVMESCAVVSNKITSIFTGYAETAAVYVESDTVSISNCIIAANYTGDPAEGFVNLAGIRKCDYTLLQSSDGVIGEGNVIFPQPSVTFEEGRFTLLPASPAIDGGYQHPWMADALDLYGGERIIRSVDMGPVEYSKELEKTVSLVADITSVYEGDAVTFNPRARVSSATLACSR